jgi:hypothetical protein
MKSPHTFHMLYKSVHRAHKDEPDIFTLQVCKEILTAVMGRQSFSWKVVGITKGALEVFAKSDFKYKSGQGITRAHLVPRVETVKQLLSESSPYDQDRFVEFWNKNDMTVICAKGENKSSIPNYIPIANLQGALFSCEGKLAGWHHKKEEISFLKDLHKKKGS